MMARTALVEGRGEEGDDGSPGRVGHAALQLSESGTGGG